MKTSQDSKKSKQLFDSIFEETIEKLISNGATIGYKKDDKNNEIWEIEGSNFSYNSTKDAFVYNKNSKTYYSYASDMYDDKKYVQRYNSLKFLVINTRYEQKALDKSNFLYQINKQTNNLLSTNLKNIIEKHSCFFYIMYKTKAYKISVNFSTKQITVENDSLLNFAISQSWLLLPEDRLELSQLFNSFKSAKTTEIKQTVNQKTR